MQIVSSLNLLKTIDICRKAEVMAANMRLFEKENTDVCTGM